MPVTENPTIDTVEIWSLFNLTPDTHPIHLHLVRFQEHEDNEMMRAYEIVQVAPQCHPPRHRRSGVGAATRKMWSSGIYFRARPPDPEKWPTGEEIAEAVTRTVLA